MLPACRHVHIFRLFVIEPLGRKCFCATALLQIIKSKVFFQSMKYDVFISYSSADSKHAFDVCAFLESNNLKCWIAPRNIRPGAPYAHEIVQGINNSSFCRK